MSSAATTSALAAYSAHDGRSPRNSIPLTTPSTGMSSMLIENTLTGTEVAILIHAQCAKANAMKTLYAVPSQAATPTSRKELQSSSKAAPMKIGMPPISMIHAV